MTFDRCGLRARLADAGYALLPAAAACATLQLDLAGLDALRDSWERLPRDAYLRDGGAYRARRHSCFVHTPAAGPLEAVPHRPHWQPTSYNALHGGLTRWFEPVEPAVRGAPAPRRAGSSRRTSSASTLQAASAVRHPRGRIAMVWISSR
jgi:hypothetical protein